MMKVLFRLLTAAAAILPAVLSLGQVIDHEATWVARHCGAVSERLLRDEAFLATTEGYPTISIRIGGEFVLPTRVSVIIVEGQYRVRVVQAEGRPICEQLLALKRSNPSISVDSAVPMIMIKTRERVAVQVDGLEEHVKRLRRIDTRLWPSDTLYAPGRSYEVVIEGSKEKFIVRFSTPEPLAESVAYSGTLRVSQPALSRWLRRLLEILAVDLDASAPDDD